MNKGGKRASGHVLGIVNLVRIDAKFYLIAINFLGQKMEKDFLRRFCLLFENKGPGELLSRVQLNATYQL